MPAPYASPANAATENCGGQADAQRFLQRVGSEYLDCDELLRLFLLAQQAHPERLRGFARVVQKQLERGHA